MGVQHVDAQARRLPGLDRPRRGHEGRQSSEENTAIGTVSS
jgi:hypothetical protein